ncbi:unnamed protein product [Closterium sp. NIES-53]
MDSRRLRFDAEGRPIEFGTWLRLTQRYLTSQRQDGATLYAHTSGTLQATPRPEPLPAVPPLTQEAQVDYARLVLVRDVWDSCYAAVALALTEVLPPTEAAHFDLLPPTEAAHFDLVETPKEVYDAISARYSTLSSASLSRILMAGVLSPNFLPSLLLVPLLLCRSLRTLQLFLPRTGRNEAREARKGGRVVEAVAVVEVALGAAVVAVAVVHQAEGALEEVLTRLLEEVRPAVVRGPSSSSHSSSSHSRDSSSSKDSSSGRHHSSFSRGDPHCSGMRSSTEALHHRGDLEDPGALAAAAALPAWPLAPRSTTPAPATTGATPDRAVPVSAAAMTTLRRSASVASTTSTVCAGAPVFLALGACVASGSDTPPAEASLSFTLDSSASQCFFRDHTALTPLLAPVLVALADPSSGPAIARNSTTLLCPVVPSGVLHGLHIPSFTRNLVGVGYLQDRGITGVLSGLYVLHTERFPVASSAQVAASPQVPVPSPVAVSGQVEVSCQVAASCSCWSLAHPTVLWHHRLGHLSLPRLRSMASHNLVSGLPRVFLSLPPSLAPPCTPCVAGHLRATPHSSSLRLATAPFQTLHLDVWGPAPILGPERERYFLVVVDDYSMYTTVFPLAKKSEVNSTLIRWLLAIEGSRGNRVRCLHSDRGGEFCSGVLAGFCGEQGMRQSWTLPESPQHNGVAERRIGLVMDIARTSMIHASAPHFLWPYVLRYAAHQLNLQPCFSQPEVSPTSLWTRSPGVGSAFHVWGCLALVRDTSADKLSARAISCVFLSFPVGSPDYSFYHPPLHQFIDSRDVRFDESVFYYNRYPFRGLLVPSLPLFLASSLPPAPSPPVPPPPLLLPGQQPLALLRQVTVDSVGVGDGGAATGGTRFGGARSRGAGAGGAGAGGASSGGAVAGGFGNGGASSGGTKSGGAGAGGVGTGSASSGGAGVGGTGAVGAGTEETGAGGSPTALPTAPPHCHNTRFQALHRLEREEQEQLEQERQELQQLDQQ